MPIIMGKNASTPAFLITFWLLHILNGTAGTANLTNIITFTTMTGGEEQEITTTESMRHRMKDKPLGPPPPPPPPHSSPPFTLDRILSPDAKGHCRRQAKCERLNYTSCMGVKLPYTSTTLDLVDDVANQEQVMEKLALLAEGLRHIPKCWAVIQPLLCSLYMPRCEGSMVDLPSQEMCKMTQSPCRLIIGKYWPSFPKCDDISKFPPKCKNDVRELRFNTTGQCISPLVQTDNSLAFFEGVEGCGIQCQNPLFTEDEQQQLYNVIAYGGTICTLFNLFTIMTFFIDWRSANKYPPLIVFYINFCFLVSCMGWMAQFLPGARRDIVCRKDGTLRVSEPSAVENLSCVAIFVLIYYSVMAALVWFVILTYAWHISFQSFGKIQDNMDKKGVYFHMAAWSIPLVLTITTMALGEIDGSSVAGICFVGYAHHAYRAGFLWGPLFCVVLISGFFLSRVLYTLITLKISSQDVVSELAVAKIQKTITRIGLFSLFMLVAVITSFICHTYELLNHSEWKQAFRKYIVCLVASSAGLGGAVPGGEVHADPRLCRLHPRPSVSVFQLYLLVFFCAGVVMSSWVWTASTVQAWRRFLRRVLNNEKEERVKMTKHKAIAQAFANWKTFNAAGRLSITFHSSHEDPVGLNLNKNSIASLDFSSTWAAALPTLMTRRGAVIGSAPCSRASSCSNSNSEISVSVRKFWMDQRRRRSTSGSQLSVQISEFTATRKGRWCGGPPRNKRRRHREPRIVPLAVQAGSSTSQDSHLGVQAHVGMPFSSPLFPSLTPSIPNIPNFMPRNRAARLPCILPFPLPGRSLDLSDDASEEQPKASVQPGQEMQVMTVAAIATAPSALTPCLTAARDGGNDNCARETVEELDRRSHHGARDDYDSQVTEGRERASRGSHKSQGHPSSLVAGPTDPSQRSAAGARDDSGYKTTNGGAPDPVSRRSQGSSLAGTDAPDSEGRRSANKRKIVEEVAYRPDSEEEEDEEGEEEEDGQRCNNHCSIDIAGLSESSSFCPELMHLVSVNSGVSCFTQHSLGGGRVRTVGVGPRVVQVDAAVQATPQEIAGQTALDDAVDVEGEERQRLLGPLLVSQGVQASIPGECGCGLQRLVRELALRQEQQLWRPAGRGGNGLRSRSAEEHTDKYILPL